MSKCVICNIRKSHKNCTGLCIECFHDQKDRYCKECGKSIYSVQYMLCSTCYHRYITMGPLKLKCHNILGWECKCCGRNDVNLLEMDHIERIEGKRLHLRQTYNEIILIGENAHKKYQILCHLCNNSKGEHGECTLNHKYDLNNLREAILHMKELGARDLDYIKIPKTI